MLKQLKFRTAAYIITVVLLAWIALVVVSIPGCASARETRPVVEDSRQAVVQAAALYAADLAAMREMIEATSLAVEILTRGEVADEFILRDYIVAGNANPDALDRDLSDPEANTALVLEVREGRMTADAARLFLADYAALSAVSTGAAYRHEMLSRLKPVKSIVVGREALLKAFDEGAGLRLSLLREAGEGLDVVILAGGAEPLGGLFSEAALPVWESSLFSLIEDETTRAAALNLWRSIGRATGSNNP